MGRKYNPENRVTLTKQRNLQVSTFISTNNARAGYSTEDFIYLSIKTNIQTTSLDVGAGCILEKMDGKGSNGYNNCCYCREHTAMCFLISSDVKTWGENQYEE